MVASDDRTGMIQVELDEAELKKRGQALASAELELEQTIEKKVSHNRGWNEDIKQLKVRISVLAAEVDSHMAWVPAQSGMFDEDGVVTDTDEEEPAKPARRGRGRSRTASADLGDAA
jgi:hypothetical protein